VLPPDVTVSVSLFVELLGASGNIATDNSTTKALDPLATMTTEYSERSSD
jgi:hypothetical protein